MQIKNEYLPTMTKINNSPNAWIYSRDGNTIDVASTFWEKLRICVRYIFKPSIFGTKLDAAMMKVFSDNVLNIIRTTIEYKDSLNPGIFYRYHFDRYALCDIDKQNPNLFKNLNSQNSNLTSFEPNPRLLERCEILRIANWIDSYSNSPFIPPKDHWLQKRIAVETKEKSPTIEKSERNKTTEMARETKD